jgi:hypothetical protein
MPILFIKKNDSLLQLTVDYWGLNCITKKDRYPLPLITDLLDCLCSVCIFIKVDLQAAYNLIHIVEDNKWKTTFEYDTALMNSWSCIMASPLHLHLFNNL